MKCAAVAEGITTEFKREYTNVNYEAETTVRTLKKLMELGLMQKRGNEKNTVYYRESK